MPNKNSEPPWQLVVRSLGETGLDESRRRKRSQRTESGHILSNRPVVDEIQRIQQLDIQVTSQEDFFTKHLYKKDQVYT